MVPASEFCYCLVYNQVHGRLFLPSGTVGRRPSFRSTNIGSVLRRTRNKFRDSRAIIQSRPILVPLNWPCRISRRVCCTENPMVLAASATLTNSSSIIIDLIIFLREDNVNRTVCLLEAAEPTGTLGASGFEQRFAL